MCISPTLIPNPYKGRFVDGRTADKVGYGYLHDTVSNYIKVPCGVCPECVSLKQNYILQRCELLFTDHDVFFGTLTYDNKHLPSITDSLGNTHYYADRNHFYLMIKRMRKNGIIPPDTKFIYVSEFGKKKHRPHFHFLMFVPRTVKFSIPALEDAYLVNLETRLYRAFFSQWAVNVGTRKNPKYDQLFTYHEKRVAGVIYRNFDFHRVVLSSRQTSLFNSAEVDSKDHNSVAAYVTKYVLKYDKWFRKYIQRLHETLGKSNPEEYENIKVLISPKCSISRHFGDDQKYFPLVRKGIDFALNQGKSFRGYKFISPLTGKFYPLCPYLKHKFVTLDDAHRWYFECAPDNPNIIDSPCVVGDFERSMSNILNTERVDKNIIEFLGSRDSDPFDILYSDIEEVDI